MSDDDDLSNEDEDQPLPLDAPDNAADPASAKRKKYRISKEFREKIGYWRGVLGTKQGRHEHYELLKDTGFFEGMFMSSPVGFPDYEASMYKRGRRDQGMRMFFDWMKFARAETFLMLDENDDQFKPYAIATEALDGGRL